MGPALVSKDEVADPHNLRIGFDLNGETLQDSNTKQFVFDIPYLVAYLSTVMTLEPGDVISTARLRESVLPQAAGVPQAGRRVRRLDRGHRRIKQSLHRR